MILDSTQCGGHRGVLAPLAESSPALPSCPRTPPGAQLSCLLWREMGEGERNSARQFQGRRAGLSSSPFSQKGSHDDDSERGMMIVTFPLSLKLCIMCV